MVVGVPDIVKTPFEKEVVMPGGNVPSTLTLSALIVAESAPDKTYFVGTIAVLTVTNCVSVPVVCVSCIQGIVSNWDVGIFFFLQEKIIIAIAKNIVTQ